MSNKKHKIVISFRKLWDLQEGTVYKKVIRISKQVFHSWLLARQADIAMFNDETDTYVRTFLPAAINLQGKNQEYKMLNLTQSAHFVNWVKTKADAEINLKRAQYDCNTCLLVED